MYEKAVEVMNKTGLHARPASDFVATASKFNSKVFIRNVDEDSDKVNAKSIIMLLAMGVSKGTTIEVSAEGDDEEEAVEALVALVESKFGED